MECFSEPEIKAITRLFKERNIFAKFETSTSPYDIHSFRIIIKDSDNLHLKRQDTPSLVETMKMQQVKLMCQLLSSPPVGLPTFEMDSTNDGLYIVPQDNSDLGYSRIEALLKIKDTQFKHYFSNSRQRWVFAIPYSNYNDLNEIEASPSQFAIVPIPEMKMTLTGKGLYINKSGLSALQVAVLAEIFNAHSIAFKHHSSEDHGPVFNIPYTDLENLNVALSKIGLRLNERNHEKAGNKMVSTPAP